LFVVRPPPCERPPVVGGFALEPPAFRKSSSVGLLFGGVLTVGFFAI